MSEDFDFSQATSKFHITSSKLKTQDSELARLRAEVAALAEQNQAMREALTYIVSFEMWDQAEAERIVSLPDLATPAIARVKAEALREAAEKAKSADLMLWDKYYRVLMTMADELEGNK